MCKVRGSKEGDDYDEKVGPNTEKYLTSCIIDDTYGIGYEEFVKCHHCTVSLIVNEVTSSPRPPPVPSTSISSDDVRL